MLRRYLGPDDLPKRIPVFPLLGVILLPRAALPLNIFEPRYIEMFEDALKEDRLIGIVQPQRDAASRREPGGDAGEESPAGKGVALRRTGCLGRITAFLEADDSRLIVTLTGISRFDIVDEEPTLKRYRQCHVNYGSYGGDFAIGLGQEEVDRETLLAALKEYLEANSLQADWNTISKAGNEFLVNTLSVISPYGPEEKQALLEASTLKARAQVLVALAEMELATRDDGSGSTLQ